MRDGFAIGGWGSNFMVRRDAMLLCVSRLLVLVLCFFGPQVAARKEQVCPMLFFWVPHFLSCTVHTDTKFTVIIPPPGSKDSLPRVFVLPANMHPLPSSFNSGRRPHSSGGSEYAVDQGKEAPCCVEEDIFLPLILEFFPVTTIAK